MFRKIGNIIGSFYKTLTIKDLLNCVILPFILSILSSFFILKISLKELSKFINNFNDSFLTLVTLLAAFGIASVTLLFTSSSENIQKAKEQPAKKKDFDNIPINYYQLILIRNYYSLFVQFLAMIIAIIIKIVIVYKCYYAILFLEIFLIFHIIFVQLMVIISLYYLMWKDKS